MKENHKFTKEYLSNNMNFIKTFMALAVPMIFQQFINMSMILLDNFMVGSLGVDIVAAVGFANKVSFVLILVLFGCVSGCSIFISQYYGKQSYDKLKHLFALIIIISLAISLLFMIVAIISPEQLVAIFTKDEKQIMHGSKFLYILALSFPFFGITIAITSALRAMGYTKYPLYISIFVTIINAILNYGLIYGNLGMPRLYEEGSALATFISRIIEALLFVFIIIKYSKKFHLYGKIREFFGIKLSMLKEVIKVSIPIVLTDTIWSIAGASLLVAYAKLGTSAAASALISDNLMNIVSVFCLGCAVASSTLVAQSIGYSNGDLEVTKLISNKILKFMIYLSVILSIISIAMVKPILMIYELKPNEYEDAFMVLTVLSAVIGFRVYNWMLIVGVLRAGGDTKVALYIDTGFLLFYAVPATFLLAIYTDIPIYYLVLVSSAEEALKLIAALLRYKSFKWIHDLTQSGSQNTQIH